MLCSQLSYNPLLLRDATDVQMIKGFTNVFAGGEGLFMTTLTGPGVVWLQGQPPGTFAGECSAFDSVCEDRVTQLTCCILASQIG